MKIENGGKEKEGEVYTPSLSLLTSWGPRNSLQHLSKSLGLVWFYFV